jgi:hypothetical protein
MKYMLMICDPADGYGGDNGHAVLMDIVAKHMALAQELRESGVMLEGAGLEGIETATTLTIGGGKHTIHDGPYAETREHLGGYYVIDVPDLDAALAVAKRIPGVDGTKVEIRPVMAED